MLDLEFIRRERTLAMNTIKMLSEYIPEDMKKRRTSKYFQSLLEMNETLTNIINSEDMNEDRRFFFELGTLVGIIGCQIVLMKKEENNETTKID